MMPAFIDLRRRHYVRPEGDGFVLAFGLLGRWLLGQMSAAGDLAVVPDSGQHPQIAKLVLDESRRRAFLGEREIQLSQQEYRFLRRLMREAGAVVDRVDLAKAVWPGRHLGCGLQPGFRADQRGERPGRGGQSLTSYRPARSYCAGHV